VSKSNDLLRGQLRSYEYATSGLAAITRAVIFIPGVLRAHGLVFLWVWGEPSACTWRSPAYCAQETNRTSRRRKISVAVIIYLAKDDLDRILLGVRFPKTVSWGASPAF